MVVVGIASGGATVAGLLGLCGIGLYQLLRRPSNRAAKSDLLKKSSSMPGVFIGENT